MGDAPESRLHDRGARERGADAGLASRRPRDRARAGTTGPHVFAGAVAAGLGAGVALLMAAALVHGLVAGDIFAEGAWLLSLAWGRVTVIDVYAGLTLFAAWVWWREPRAWVAGGWIVALCLLGNLAAGCYVALAAFMCRGSAPRFWLGSQRAGNGST